MSMYANIEDYFDNFIKSYDGNDEVVKDLKELKEMVLERLGG